MADIKVEIAVGETRRIKIMEMGSAGYLWNFRDVPDGSARIDAAAVASEAGDPRQELRIGGGVEYEVTIQGIRPGTTTVRHVRPFALDDVADTLTVVVA